MTVLVVGDLVTDILAIYSGPIAAGSDTPARITLVGGGSAANTAAWLAATGVPARLVAVVGTDPAADDRLTELSTVGVDVDTVRREPGARTGSVLVLSDGSERTMFNDRGANLLLSPADVDAALAVPGARHLHLSGYTLLDDASRAAGRHALTAAKNHGLTTSVDAASAGPLRRSPDFLSWVLGTDLLLANVDEAAVLVSDGTPESLARAFGGTAVVKLGAEGAVWCGAGGTVRVPASAAAPVDPTGAGDAFAAGLLGAWLDGAGPAEALRAGAAFGARAVAQVGARPAAPTPDG